MPHWHDTDTPELARASSSGVSTKEMWIHLKGSWRLPDLPDILQELRSSPLSAKAPLLEGTSIFIDGSQLEAIDTASVQTFLNWLLPQLPKGSHDTVKWAGLKPEIQSIIELVSQSKFRDSSGEDKGKGEGLVAKVGKSTLENLAYLKSLLSFIGATVVEMGLAIIRPRGLRLRELFVQLEMVGMNAIPIVALVTFLIGIVIAYLFGIQVQKYGANLFIVDGCVIAMCRELSPIITAIIVAGRSGSAFTAQLGAMKINEEVDALSVLGLSPMRVLVLPRVLALMIALPLLVFVGDVVGIIGSMVIADLKLDVTGVTFINRMQAILTVRSFVVGLVKAPVFALFIAIIGCQMGLSVESNARSLGMGTTATVVKSIVAVILLNAGFSVLFSELKI